ncbi:Na+/H+ antiporter NhaD [Psychrosphaera saromensis]|uniref:Sodium:proton antiporter n=1 Tax=Psychrosphaera saromensis TaxID=716813 RepID=A0A2S7UTI7_9GAMM|nr:sodium:proton antiporter NhaD [Psychrosphaera saromensis]PQJ53253.1 sodium:proton antiporter [Psychrosphaera saromensis]GHB66840.1 Na+/H+ antiporter NhaD [Psychrosphaera saromensis]GLQ14981.1 Na+/H+ antiporter NhaD [Psychrosphaera saromensis]
MLEYSLIFIAFLALLSIVFEEITHINKAKTTLFLGCLSWIILFIAAEPAQHELINHSLEENLLEIAVLWLFLMSTMTFVAYLNSKGVIQMAVQRLFPAKASVTIIMFLVAIFSLLLSAICDNITATLVSLTLLQSFNVDTRTKLRMAILVVFAVNSGGVALITGDVTTLMIYLEGHLQISQLFMLLLPSLVSVLFLAGIFSIGLKGQVITTPAKKGYETVDVLIAIIFFSTILSTMLFNVFFAIPPVLTFLTGLSVMFLVGQMYKNDKQEREVLEYIRQIEFDTLLFFLGILLLVGMLKEIGILQMVTQLYAQFDPMYSNYVAGIGSSLLDNVPLTAALLKAEPILNSAQWLGLTYAVGVGGSLLVIGSASGIIAMSKLKEITFFSYCRYIPALLVAYTIGYALTIYLGRYFY